MSADAKTLENAEKRDKRQKRRGNGGNNGGGNGLDDWIKRFIDDTWFSLGEGIVSVKTAIRLARIEGNPRAIEIFESVYTLSGWGFSFEQVIAVFEEAKGFTDNVARAVSFLAQAIGQYGDGYEVPVNPEQSVAMAEDLLVLFFGRYYLDKSSGIYRHPGRTFPEPRVREMLLEVFGIELGNTDSEHVRFLGTMATTKKIVEIRQRLRLVNASKADTVIDSDGGDAEPEANSETEEILQEA